MPNVTIAISQEMKDEMDKYAEVNWSEICRTAILAYITQRGNPKPIIDLEQGLTRVRHYDHEIGYPTIAIDLRVHNKMNLPIIVDRILAKVEAHTHTDGKSVTFGQVSDLRRNTIEKNSVGFATLRLPLLKEKLLEFKGRFIKTFDCTVTCNVFVDGFKDAYTRELFVQIPIDLWNRTIDEALKRSQENQATK